MCPLGRGSTVLVIQCITKLPFIRRWTHRKARDINDGSCYGNSLVRRKDLGKASWDFLPLLPNKLPDLAFCQWLTLGHELRAEDRTVGRRRFPENTASGIHQLSRKSSKFRGAGGQWRFWIFQRKLSSLCLPRVRSQSQGMFVNGLSHLNKSHLNIYQIMNMHVSLSALEREQACNF